MKKIMLVIFATITLLSSAIYASHSHEVAYSNYNSPQVCQFSLSSYTGTISESGYTSSTTVRLSCPQESDIYATVVVMIDGEPAGSDIFMVKAGKTESASKQIQITDKAYYGKRYNLLVQ